MGGPSPVSSFRIIDGEPPIGQQVVIDPVQAERGGFEVGQDITISLPSGEPEVFTLSGTIDFGEGGTGGAFFILFDLPTAQRVLGLPGQVDSVVVAAADGVSPDELVTAISAVLPDNLEAVTGEVVIGEQRRLRLIHQHLRQRLARLCNRGAVRQHLHHQQHIRHPRRPTHQNVRPHALDRRQ